MEHDMPVKVREIAMVARRVSLAEAEEIDNDYWRNATIEERFQTLIDLNSMVFGKKIGNIVKVVKRRHMNDEEED